MEKIVIEDCLLIGTWYLIFLNSRFISWEISIGHLFYGVVWITE